jgi:hypothetical protein
MGIRRSVTVFRHSGATSSNDLAVELILTICLREIEKLDISIGAHRSMAGLPGLLRNPMLI